MCYSLLQIADIRSKVLRKVNVELDIAHRNNEIPEFLDKYGIIVEEERLPINTRTSRILVIGALSGNKKDFQNTAKKLGINPDNIEFIGYDEAKHLNARKLEYSNDYSDIIYGPTPHKISGMGDVDNLLALIEREPVKYPRLIRSKSNSIDGRLKLSTTGFKDYLQKTFYYESLISNF